MGERVKRTVTTNLVAKNLVIHTEQFSNGVWGYTKYVCSGYRVGIATSRYSNPEVANIFREFLRENENSFANILGG